MIICDKDQTKARLRNVEEYLSEHVMDGNFHCHSYNQCRSSHSQIFYEGQLHHIGKYYDLQQDKRSLRIVIIGQEYGHPPSRINCQKRYDMIMDFAYHYRFKAQKSYSSRNPHLRGTTSVLRLLFGIPLGTDHESEWVSIQGNQVHIFDMFALVNYLLCSAIATDGNKQGLATGTMKRNCKSHFQRVLRILEPTVIIVQGKGFWNAIKKVFDYQSPLSEHVYMANMGSMSSYVAVFSHPSSRHPTNWGSNEKTPYLLQIIAPSVQYIREKLLSDIIHK